MLRILKAVVLFSLSCVAMFFVMCLLMFSVLDVDTDASVSVSILTLFAIFVVPLVAASYVAVRVLKAPGQQTIQEPLATRQKYVARAKLQLVGGLMNLPQGSVCKAAYNKDGITFTASGQEFTLDSAKMLDVSVMTAKQIQQQYVSSAGGAIAGALLLGPLGAVLGGSVSKRKITSKSRYLVISYLSGEEVKYIVFDVTTDAFTGNHIASVFRFLKKSGTMKVEL